MGYFFFPLLRPVAAGGLQQPLDLLGRDSFVLGRLVHVLGATLHSAGAAPVAARMAPALCEFLVPLRHHRDAHVRRAVLAALLLALRSLASNNVGGGTSAASLTLRELAAWLPAVAADDPDHLCRGLAAHALAALSPAAALPWPAGY